MNNNNTGSFRGTRSVKLFLPRNLLRRTVGYRTDTGPAVWYRGGVWVQTNFVGGMGPDYFLVNVPALLHRGAGITPNATG
jgi:hypothetical protein